MTAPLLTFLTFLAAVSLESIPNPRPSGWTVDLTGTLPAGTVAELNRLGDEVKAQTGAELAVVVVDTIDGVNPREFATNLFNTWGIGERGRSNGLLVFAALGDRKAEIVLGDGVDDEARIQQSQDILQGVMVPRFRSGDASGAVLHGAIACANQILGATTTVGAEAPAPTPGPDLSVGGPSPSPPVKVEEKRPDWVFYPWKEGFQLLAGAGFLFFLLYWMWKNYVPPASSPEEWSPESDAPWLSPTFHSSGGSESSSSSDSSGSDFGGGTSSGKGASGEW